jgi:hypothetical protein
MKYLQLSDGVELPQINDFNPFKCVVIISLPVSQEWQTSVSEWLVNSGCLYMMAWGEDCSSWDDSVDYANLEKFEYQKIPPESFVTTTWHESESLSEVFWYCKNVAKHGIENLENTLLLHISDTSAQEFITLVYKKT